MNDYGRDLHFDVVLPRLKAMSFKQVLRQFAHHASEHLNVSEERLYNMLVEKEEKASSGIGDNIAIAHLKAVGPQKPFNMLATLQRPVECNAIDDEPVDVVCLVLSPETDGPYHLRRLARVSRLLTNDQLHKRLHDARDEQEIRSLLIDPEGWLMAA